MSLPVVAIDARLVAGESTGDSTYWTGLLHGFSKIKLDFQILLLSNAEKPAGIPWSEQFEWRKVKARNGRLWSIIAFPRAARRAGAAAVHTQYTLSPFVRRNGITTIHDVSFLIGPDWFRPRDRILMRRSVPGSARRAAAVIAVSRTSKEEIEGFFPSARGKTYVTYLACPPWIHPVRNAKETLEKTLGIREPFMLTVGTRWPRKNMKLAVDACDLLAAETARTLVITGKEGWGDLHPSSRTKSVGYVDAETLSALYSAADLYLAPSRHEGFGIPVLEAFTCGCPVICSSGGAFPEIAGEAAIVQQGWDAAEWSRTISETLGDSSRLDSLRELGRERASQFSWEETARQTAEIYRRVIG